MQNEKDAGERLMAQHVARGSTPTAQHTPGPWVANNDGLTIEGGIAREYVICTLDDESTTQGRDQVRADARLIAAAPEMLDALQRIASFASCDCAEHGAPCIGCIARAAIAKAESRS